jgi:hypothetical protein
LQGIALGKPGIVGIALIARHKIPGIDGTVPLALGRIGDRRFHSLFFRGRHVDQGIAGSETEFKFLLKTHNIWLTKGVGNDPTSYLMIMDGLASI